MKFTGQIHDAGAPGNFSIGESTQISDDTVGNPLKLPGFALRRQIPAC
jgi:hypothetical protein